MKTVVVGLGQKYAGDDAVALEVIAHLAEQAPPGAEVLALREPSALIDLLGQRRRVIVVDALDEPSRAGRVDVRDLSALDCRCPRGLSSHGLGVAQAVELARALHGGEHASDVRFVTISVDPRAGGSGGLREGLSPAAAAAVPLASARILELLERFAREGARAGDGDA